MQLHKTMRLAGVSLSAAALALLSAEGPAAAHERMATPDLRGRVTSVASGDFVLQKHDGTSETVDTSSATTYSEPGSSNAPSGVSDGENVAITLDPSAPSPTATNVAVFPERVGGRVTMVVGSTVTLSSARGTETVIVSPSTKYAQKGASPTGVTDGELVSVFGLPDAGTPGALDAQVVAIFSPATPPQQQSPQPQQPQTQQPQPQQPQTQQPQPQQPATADAAIGGHDGTPAAQPAPTPAPAHNPVPGGNWSAPSGLALPHVPTGSPGAAGAPGPLGAQSPGGFGGHGFSQR